jgi:hypothetical protein
VPVTRPRRTGSLVTIAMRSRSPMYLACGGTMPCSITVVRVPPLSQNNSLKWVTCTSRTSSRSAIGWRVDGTSPFGVLCST